LLVKFGCPTWIRTKTY